MILLKLLLGIGCSLFLILSSTVLASEASTEKVFTNSTKNQYLILRGEDGVFIVEKYIQSKPHGFQDLAWQKRFSSEKSAGAYVKQMAFGFRQNISKELFFSQNYLTDNLNEVLWTHENEWSWDWEKKYSQWVHENVHADFLVKYNLPTDCADVAYVIRWIFSRIHSLPAANRLAGSNEVFTNLSMRTEWLELPTNAEWSLDKRFLEALRYLLTNTYTHTLARDSYPIAINTESLTPGVHHLALHGSSGHMMAVYGVNEPSQAPLQLYYSDVPQEVRLLYSTIYYQTELPKKNSGFLRMLWPIIKSELVQFTKARDMPFYSLEQYSENFLKDDSTFGIAVMKRLQPNFSWEILGSSILNDIKNRLENRVKIVEQGFQFCKTNDCAPGTAGYENWSTPARDTAILSAFDNFDSVLVESANIKWVKEMLQNLKNSYLEIQGQKINLDNILNNLEDCSSDPRDSIEQRWGLTAISAPFMQLKAAIASDHIFTTLESTGTI